MPTVSEIVTTPAVTISELMKFSVELVLDPDRLIVLGGQPEDGFAEGTERTELTTPKHGREDAEKHQDQTAIEQQANKPAAPP